MNSVRIGNNVISSNSTFTIAEIGINHNGVLENALKLIRLAKEAGFSAVKFQKRTIDKVYTQSELAAPRESVYGNSNGDLKRGLEFGTKEYDVIDDLCKSLGILWFASPWDEDSVDFLLKYSPVAFKIASPCLTNSKLLFKVAKTNVPIVLSTGMSTMGQIGAALKIIEHKNVILLHCVSTYPAKDSDLNLSVIEVLRNEFGLLVGYSGHEVGVLPSIIAASRYRACVIERHITLDRSMWGSDQSASLEVDGFRRLINYLKLAKEVEGDGIKRVIKDELPIIKKLRKIEDF